jgi:hypothetical protein
LLRGKLIATKAYIKKYKELKELEKQEQTKLNIGRRNKDLSTA